MKNFFKVVLAAISYYSLRKVIEKLPEKYRGSAVLSLRLCVFFVLFLILFAFLSGQISAISRNLDGLPALIANVLLGIAFVVTGLLSFLLTAFIEEIYRILSSFQRKVGDTAKNVIETVTTAGESVKQSMEKTKNIFADMGRAVGDAGKALYDTSAKMADASVSGTSQFVQTALENKQAGQLVRAIVQGSKKSGELLTDGSKSAWSAAKTAGKRLGGVSAGAVEWIRSKWGAGESHKKEDV